MRRLVSRLLVVSVTGLGLMAGSVDPLPSWDEVQVRQARAQEPSASPEPSTTASPTETPSPGTTFTTTQTPAPTETIEPTAAPTDAASTPTPSPSTSPSPSSTPTPSATPGSPTATPTVPPNLPPLTETQDAPGTETEATIGAAGGRAASADGRVVIDFPAAAVAEDVSVRITKRERRELEAPSPDFPSVALWEFEATNVATNDEVHDFAADLSLIVRFDADDLAGRSPSTLQLWSFDHAGGIWNAAPTRVNALERLAIAETNHFSHWIATSNPTVDTGPLLMGGNVGLQTGSAASSISIDVAPGRGGPSTSLSSDLRLHARRGNAAVRVAIRLGGSWMGARDG